MRDDILNTMGIHLDDRSDSDVAVRRPDVHGRFERLVWDREAPIHLEHEIALNENNPQRHLLVSSEQKDPRTLRNDGTS